MSIRIESFEHLCSLVGRMISVQQIKRVAGTEQFEVTDEPRVMGTLEMINGDPWIKTRGNGLYQIRESIFALRAPELVD